MKRSIILIVIIICLSSIIVLEQLNLQSTLNGLKDRISAIKQIIYSTNDISDISSQVNELNEFWENKEPIICLSYNHKDLDKISEQITKLKSNVALNDKTNAIIEFELLTLQITSYEHLILTTIQNVL